MGRKVYLRDEVSKRGTFCLLHGIPYRLDASIPAEVTGGWGKGIFDAVFVGYGGTVIRYRGD